MGRPKPRGQESAPNHTASPHQSPRTRAAGRPWLPPQPLSLCPHSWPASAQQTGKAGEGSLQASGQSCLPTLSPGSALYLLLSPPHRTQASGAPGLPSELLSRQDRARRSRPCGDLGHLQPFLLSTGPVIACHQRLCLKGRGSREKREERRSCSPVATPGPGPGLNPGR